MNRESGKAFGKQIEESANILALNCAGSIMCRICTVVMKHFHEF